MAEDGVATWKAGFGRRAGAAAEPQLDAQDVGMGTQPANAEPFLQPILFGGTRESSEEAPRDGNGAGQATR